MKYLTAEHILVIHAEIVNTTGGTHGVRDVGLLASIIGKPQAMFGGDDLYPDIYTKAAIFLEAIANYHVFIDGNKRTAFAATLRFLFVNNIHITATQEEVVAFVIAVATKEKQVEDIAVWLKVHTV